MDFVSFIIHEFDDFLCFYNSSAVLIQTEHSSMLHRHNESARKIKPALTMLKLEVQYFNSHNHFAVEGLQQVEF